MNVEDSLKSSHEYLIEQVQHTGVEDLVAGQGAGKVDMNFNHPVKALVWTTNGDNFVTDVKVQLNGHDRFSEQAADYFHLVQPYESGLGHTKSLSTADRTWGAVAACSEVNPVGMYSFCLKPGEHQPSGSCNFSRIDNARLTYKGGKTGTAASELHIIRLKLQCIKNYERYGWFNLL